MQQKEDRRALPSEGEDSLLLLDDMDGNATSIGGNLDHPGMQIKIVGGTES